MQPLNQIEDTGRGYLVQIAGRLVCQQQPRAANQRAGKRDALLLAAGKLTRPMLAAIFQTNLP